jgi:virulence factor
MRIGIIGLGNIAQKAYLPVITTKDKLELVLCSRNTDTLNKISGMYRIPCCVDTVDELVKMGIDAAFVHSSTESHTEIVEKLLMNKINVYVDKPISYSLMDAYTLAELSERMGTTLMVGFNRRFAPMYKNLKEQENANIILMQKNRLHNPDNIRRFIFDDFIHVVDTLRFLIPGSIEDIHTSYLKKDGELYNVTLQMSGKDYTSIGIMNKDSGMTEEIVEYMSPGNKRIISDMVQEVSFVDGTQKISKFGEWDPILYRRGFFQIVDHFLESIEQGKTPSPSIQDSLVTHEICEKIVTELSKI